MTIKHSPHVRLQGGPIFDFVLDFFKQKTKAYKRNKKLTNTLKNIYVIKSKNFKTNKKRLKMKTKRRKEKLNSRLRRSFVYLSRILLTPFMFISGYANTENVFYCLNIIGCNSKAPSTNKFSFENAYISMRYAFRPHYRAERFHRKRIDLKKLLKVDQIENVCIHIVLEWKVENSKNASK